MFRDPKDSVLWSLLFIYPHNQVEIRSTAGFQILAQKLLDQGAGHFDSECTLERESKDCGGEKVMARELGFLAAKKEIGNERHQEEKVFPPYRSSLLNHLRDNAKP